MKKEDKIFGEAYLGINEVIDMLGAENGPIDQHKEKYGIDDTYELVSETVRIYNGIRNLLKNSNRDEYKQVALAMYGLQYKLELIEKEVKKERVKEVLTHPNLTFDEVEFLASTAEGGC